MAKSNFQMGCVSILLVPFVVLVALQADGADYQWGLVFIPFWVVLVGLICVCANEPEGFLSQDTRHLRPKSEEDIVWGKFVAILSLLLFSIVLVLRLDGVTDWSWLGVMSPLWVCLLLTGLSQRVSATRATMKRPDVVRCSPRLSAMLGVTLVTAAVQTLLLALWLDDRVAWGWQGLLLPVWVFDGVALLTFIGDCQTVWSKGDLAYSVSSQEQDMSRIGCFLLIILAVTQALMFSKAAGAIDASWLVVGGIPLIVTFAVGGCGLMGLSD